MDILKAHQMVYTTNEQHHIKTYTRDFDSIKNAADNFVVWARKKLDIIESRRL